MTYKCNCNIKSFIKCIKIYVSTNKIHMAAEHEQEEQNLLQFWQVEDTAIGLSLSDGIILRIIMLLFLQA